MFIMVTSFTRMVIVLSFSPGPGTQQVPPNQVLISLVVLSHHVCHGSGGAGGLQGCAAAAAWPNKSANEDAWNRGIQPIRGFMLKQMRDKDLELFWELSHSPKPGASGSGPTHVSFRRLSSANCTFRFRSDFALHSRFSSWIWSWPAS